MVATECAFIFTPKIGEDSLFGLIFLKGVGSTTNQLFSVLNISLFFHANSFVPGVESSPSNFSPAGCGLLVCTRLPSTVDKSNISGRDKHFFLICFLEYRDEKCYVSLTQGTKYFTSHHNDFYIKQKASHGGDG